jgi:hypothetical protein
MGDFAAGKASSHALLSGNAQLIMLTQNSKTDSEYFNLTPESRSGETRIKYVCLNTLDRMRCTPNGWVCDKETWHMTSVDIRYCLNQLKMERANRNWYSKSFSRSFMII